MKELFKIGITVLVVMIAYDMFIKKMVIKSQYEEMYEE
jgi:hypothetical protein